MWRKSLAMSALRAEHVSAPIAIRLFTEFVNVTPRWRMAYSGSIFAFRCERRSSGRSPGQEVGNGIGNESRSPSSPLPKGEHDSKEKSCYSAEQSFRN